MKKFNVTLQAEITVEFDENSEDFKELWKQYKEHFDSHADYQSFAENIAQFIGRYGTQEFFEGVGYVKVDGKAQTIYADGEYKKRESLVNLTGFDTDLNNMVDYDVFYTQDLSDEDSEDGD